MTTRPPVQAPYQTYSSASGAPVVFGQSGTEFGISGAGADLYTGTDACSTLYAHGAVGSAATVTTEVTSQQNMSGYAKAGFSAAAGAATPSLATSYEAESAANTLAGGAVVQTCATCSGGAKVGFVGNGGTLAFGQVNVPAAGSYRVTIVYCDGSSTGRQATISTNGSAAQTVSFTPTGSFSTVGATTVSVPLAAGSNTIGLANPSAYAPDFDRIIVAAAPG